MTECLFLKVVGQFECYKVDEIVHYIRILQLEIACPAFKGGKFYYVVLH